MSPIFRGGCRDAGITVDRTSVWPVFGFIFSTRDLHRNLRIFSRGRVTLGDVMFSSKVPSCQLAICWVLSPQGPNISFPRNFTKNYFFSKVRLVPETARSDLSSEPIKVSISVKMC